MAHCIPYDGDITINRDDNYPPIIWQFATVLDPLVLVPLAGSNFRLTVEWRPHHSMTVDSSVSPDLAIDLNLSTVTWYWRGDDVQLMPGGRIADYHLQREISGTVQTWAEGKVILEGETELGNPLIDEFGQTLTDEKGAILTVI
jgi:hypothetical protein